MPFALIYLVGFEADGVVCIIRAPLHEIRALRVHPIETPLPSGGMMEPEINLAGQRVLLIEDEALVVMLLDGTLTEHSKRLLRYRSTSPSLTSISMDGKPSMSRAVSQGAASRSCSRRATVLRACSRIFRTRRFSRSRFGSGTSRQRCAWRFRSRPGNRPSAQSVWTWTREANLSDETHWRADIASLVFPIRDHGAICAVHQGAFRTLLGIEPTPEACLGYFTRFEATFRAAARAKIVRKGIPAGVSLHLTSRDIARKLLEGDQIGSGDPP